MAEGELVLCSPLCVLLAKYSNTAVKLQKKALLDYYDAEVLSEAKRQLLKDVNTVKLQVGFDLPHIFQLAAMAIIVLHVKWMTCLIY